MRRSAIAVPLAALALLTGCSSGDDSDNAAGTAATQPDSAPMTGGATAAAKPSAAASGTGKSTDKKTTVVSGRVQPSNEQIIKNARVSVAVADIDAARNQAVAYAEGVGGDVASEQRAGTDQGRTATITFRVPPADFDSLVTSLGKLGKVIESTTETQDVTADVADLKGRLAAKKDMAARVRKLIDRAEGITAIVELEREYEARDAEIQSMTSQLAALQDRAGRSTVTLSLSIPKKAPAPAPPVVEEDEATGFVPGVKAGWKAFTATTTVVLTVIGALLPFLVLTGIFLAAWLVYRRRHPAPVRQPAPAGVYAAPGAGGPAS